MPEYTGFYRAAVYDINDPERRGRLRLLVPSVLGDAPSGWAEPALETAADPVWKSGDRAFAIFEGGDINKPVYISRMEVQRGDIAPGAIGPEEIDPEAVPPAQTFSPNPPVVTDGYADDHVWWQYADDEVKGMWRFKDGAWVPAVIVTYDALVAQNAFIEVLASLDFTVIRNFIAEGTSTFYDPVTFNDEVVANAGVGTPGVAAVLDNDNPVLWPDSALSGVKGLCDTAGGTAWVTCTTSGIYTIDKTTGAVTQVVAGSGPITGVTRIGSEYFLGRTDGGTGLAVIERYDSTWTNVQSWTYSGGGTGYVALGTDGTRLLLVRASGLEVRRLTVGAVGAAYTFHSSVTLGTGFINPTAITETAADIGSTRFITSAASVLRVHNNSTGARVTGDEWLTNLGAGVGLWWDGTRFWAMTSQGAVYKHATSTSTATLTATHAVTDGTEVTAASTVVSNAYARAKRWHLKVSVPPPPTTPSGLSSRVYVGTSGTRYQQTLTDVYYTDSVNGFIDVHVLSGTTAPTTKSGPFTGELSGRFRAETETVPGQPDWDLNGDGTWYLKDISDAWTTYTPTWSAATTAPTLGNGTLAGRYKVVGKTVHVQITLQYGSTTSNGAGQIRLSPPSGLPISGITGQSIGTAVYFDDSAGAYYGGWARRGGLATEIVVQHSGSPSLQWAGSQPVAAGVNDKHTLSLTYETT
jgi:hypothetical protein